MGNVKKWEEMAQVLNIFVVLDAETALGKLQSLVMAADKG